MPTQRKEMATYHPAPHSVQGLEGAVRLLKSKDRKLQLHKARHWGAEGTGHGHHRGRERHPRGKVHSKRFRDAVKERALARTLGVWANPSTCVSSLTDLRQGPSLLRVCHIRRAPSPSIMESLGDMQFGKGKYIVT